MTEIPVIVQYWHALPPPEVQQLMETWRNSAKDEGFEYLRFDDSTALQFIERRYDQRTADAYAACAVPAMKADFLRICALLVRPGIYVDADTRRSGKGSRLVFSRENTAPLLPLYQRLERGILFKRKSHTVANGFIVVKSPRDILLDAILRRAIRNIEQRISNNVFTVTGPGIATNWLLEHGTDHEYFRGFEFWTQDMLLPYMRLVGKLPYKRTGDHWVVAQKTRSIFAPTERF